MPIGSELSAAQGALVSRSFPCLDYSPPRCREVMYLKTEERTFVRVGEAAMILGISKSAAYELANSGRATEGRAGLPAVRMGRCIFVPRAALDRLAAVGGDHNNLGLVG